MSRSIVTTATIINGHVRIVFPGAEGDRTTMYPVGTHSVQDAIEYRRRKDMSRRERYNYLAKHILPLLR